MQHSSSKIRLCAVSLAMLGMAGCGVGYYWQAASGHLALMRQARPIEEVLADPQTSRQLRDKLVGVTAAVAFAHQHLLLPDNGSYTSYADLDRPYVVWNVVAAPPLSLEPRTWCFPVAGCISYRGYFALDSARKFAAQLRAAGDDVFVGGVPAYSTLGRFADPLLNTMMDRPDYRLAGTIFHELAHQRLYVRDDTSFNEGFASFIEAEGMRRWLRDRGDVQSLCRYRLERARHRQLLDMLGAIRAVMGAVYALDIPDAAKLQAKAALLATVPAAYDRLQASWNGAPNFDHWFAAPFNNARFAILAAYDDDVPAFAALLAQSGGDLDEFYRRADELAAEPAAERRIQLEALKAMAIADGAETHPPEIDIPGAEKPAPGIACASEPAAANPVDRGASRVSAASGQRPAR